MEDILFLKNAPWLKNKALLALFAIYEEAGFDIRPVGGCIRDALLHAPIHDWDLTTNATPEQNLEICQNAGLHVVPTGLKHGTITAILNHIPFEITTLRIDEKTDGRHAKVIWTKNWQQDAKRRDFTINALYGDKTGHIHDYFGGIKDLKCGLIRFVGEPDLRVKEDYLRILRYFRFMARFGDFKQIDKASLQACMDYKTSLTNISSERIYSELMKILIARQRHQAVQLMEKVGIFRILDLPIKNASLQALGDTEKKLGFEKSALRALAFLLAPHTDWGQIAHGLKFSNKEKKHLKTLQQYSQLQPPLSLTQLRSIIYLHGLEIAQDIYILKYHPACEIITDWQAITPLPFPLSGADLIQQGLEPSPQMGEILKTLEQEYIKSDFSLSKEELLKAVKI